MQLAGHLRGRALVEWNLLGAEDKSTYSAATLALCARLDPGSKILAAQDFRHSMQKDDESVADFVRRMERFFQTAYGRDNLSVETRETILYSQLQEGLKYSIVKSPSVSGCQSYKELCMAAKNEEKRMAGLLRRQQYQRGGGSRESSSKQKVQSDKSDKSQLTSKVTSGAQFKPVRKCYECGSTEHLSWNCKKSKHKKESSGQPKKTNTKMVKADDDPLSFLCSDSEEEGVRLVRVEDRGSRPRTVTVDLQGVQVRGVVDSGADITIMGADVFKNVASVARLKKSSFKKADKVPYTYDGKSFKLDGRMDLDISFDGRTILYTSKWMQRTHYFCRREFVISYR